MAAGFSVKDALNKNSKAGIDESPRARFRTKDISIFKMYQKGNIYQCKGNRCEIHRREHSDRGQQSTGNHHQSECEF